MHFNLYIYSYIIFTLIYIYINLEFKTYNLFKSHLIKFIATWDNNNNSSSNNNNYFNLGGIIKESIIK